MLGLISFLTASGVKFDPADTKIHLACWNGEDRPIDVYYSGHFKEWQEHQGRKNFKGSYVMGLIDLGRGHWLFAGVYRVLGCKPHPQFPEAVLYSTELLAGQDDLLGRIIVAHQRTRQSYVWCKPDMALTIAEVRRERMTIADFPGYNAVVISYASLQIIARQRIASWHAALSNIRGIYLILDTATGKPYVGKASGEVGIWQRWCAYADNGHGGNVELKRLLKDTGADYAKNFQYSILEIVDTHASDADILRREGYWMEVLKSRQFGLN